MVVSWALDASFHNRLLMARKTSLWRRIKGENAADRFLIPGIIVVGLIIFGVIWEFSPLAAYATPEKIAEVARNFAQKPMAPFIMVGLFVLSQLIFFPLIIMTLATAMVFGPIEGILISLTGASISAAIAYGAGLAFGKYGLKRMIGPVCERIRSYIEGTGIVGMIALRFVPAAPYSIVNIALGVLSIPFTTYIAGSFLALLPGCIIRSFLGGAITDLWENPDAKNVGVVAIGIGVWLLMVITCHVFVNRWRKKHGISSPDGHKRRKMSRVHA